MEDIEPYHEGFTRLFTCSRISRRESDLFTEEEDALDDRPLPTEPGDALFFDSFVQYQSGPNMTDNSSHVLYVTCNTRTKSDHRRQYYIDKRKKYPPDRERETDREYIFRV